MLWRYARDNADSADAQTDEFEVSRCLLSSSIILGVAHSAKG